MTGSARIICVLLCLILIVGCGPRPQVQIIIEMVETFVEAVDRGDEELAMDCLLDQDGFLILNKNLGTRTNSASEEMLGSLMGDYSRMVSYFDGRDVTLKKFTLGQFWDQYKGHAGFYNSRAILDVNGDEYEIVIKAMVRIADIWYIIDLEGNEF